MFRAVTLALIVSHAALSGCFLISSDIADFDLSMPEREFTIDTEQWDLMGGATFPMIPCDTANDICMQASTTYCDSEGCSAVCNAETAACQLTVLVSLSEDVNLLEEKPELRDINNQPIVSVTIDRVEYQIMENTLNFDSPEITFYVAPVNVMDPDSPEARPIGTIASIEAGRQTDWTEVALTSQGRADLREFMGDYQSTFNIIVGAQVEINAGDPTPTGRAVARMRVAAHAGL